MGYVEWMEKRAQQEMLKRAMEAAWTVSCCIGMVFGPLCTAFEASNVPREEVDALIDHWREAWKDVQHLSDRNLGRNREHYFIRPNVMLSPILMRLAQSLEAIRNTANLDAPAVLVALKDAYLCTVSELYEFNKWAKASGPTIGFDASKYEPEAVKRGQRYWESTVRDLNRA